MKLIHLNLKHECVLVELPEGAKNIRIGDWGNFVYDSPRAGEFAIDTLVPLAYRKFLGKFTDLKEEDFEGVVHKSGNIYADYKDWSFSEKLYSYFNARESFISVIQAEGWYTENPYEKTCNKNMGDALSYIQAQEKVINLSNCYLFVKL